MQSRSKLYTSVRRHVKIKYVSKQVKVYI